MALNATIGRVTQQRVVVQNTGGILQTQTPITLKNQVKEITSIEDISDVAEVDVSSGATIIYNASNDKYEIRKLQSTDISGSINLDGGEF